MSELTYAERMSRVHCEGVANDAIPLCIEAEMRERGWTADDLVHAELADVEEHDDLEFSEHGFWAVTCPECTAVMHA